MRQVDECDPDRLELTDEGDPSGFEFIRADIAEQWEAELLKVLGLARLIIDSFGYALAIRQGEEMAAHTRERMNAVLLEIDRAITDHYAKQSQRPTLRDREK